MITCNYIHISQEIFAIDILTALFWDCYDYMETRLKPGAQADQCKEQFFWSHNKQLLFAVFGRESYINNPSAQIRIEHCTQLWPQQLVGSGSRWPSNYKPESEKKRITRQSVKSWKKHY